MVWRVCGGLRGGVFFVVTRVPLCFMPDYRWFEGFLSFLFWVYLNLELGEVWGFVGGWGGEFIILRFALIRGCWMQVGITRFRIHVG